MKLLKEHTFSTIDERTTGKPCLRLYGTNRVFRLHWTDGSVFNDRDFADAMNRRLSPEITFDWLEGKRAQGYPLKRSTVGSGSIGCATMFTTNRSVADELFEMIGNAMVDALDEIALHNVRVSDSGDPHRMENKEIAEETLCMTNKEAWAHIQMRLAKPGRLRDSMNVWHIRQAIKSRQKQ